MKVLKATHIFLVPALLAGCSIGKSIDEMKDNNKIMNENMKVLADIATGTRQELHTMNGNLKELKENAAKTQKSIEESREFLALSQGSLARMQRNTNEARRSFSKIYDQLREANAEKNRQESLSILLQNMLPPSFKANASKRYFMNFEFQLWLGSADDGDGGKREALEAKAALDFFNEVSDFLVFFSNENEKPNYEKPRPEDVTLFKFVENLEAISPEQEALHRSEPQGVPLVSMFNILEWGLRAKVEKAKTPDKLTIIERNVLAFEEAADFLMQVRFNYLAHLAAGDPSLRRIAKALETGKILELRGEHKVVDADVLAKWSSLDKPEFAALKQLLLKLN